MRVLPPNDPGSILRTALSQEVLHVGTTSGHGHGEWGLARVIADVHVGAVIEQHDRHFQSALADAIVQRRRPVSVERVHVSPSAQQFFNDGGFAIIYCVVKRRGVTRTGGCIQQFGIFIEERLQTRQIAALCSLADIRGGDDLLRR